MSVKKKQITGEEFYRLFEGDAAVVASYQIGFALVTQANDAEDAVLAGSGTLVSIDGRKGILTADHVIQNLLGRQTSVGLIHAKHGKSQIVRFIASCSHQRRNCVLSFLKSLTHPSARISRLFISIMKP
jgi:hypothetical protein